MNKKFSTLMAGLMLASVFSANAVIDKGNNAKYENGKYYLLGNGRSYISVVSNPDGDTDGAYGDLVLKTATDIDNNLQETREALWKVNVTTGTQGQAPRYTFQNVATGLMLSVPVPPSSTPVDAEISGSMMEWYNGTVSTNIQTPSPLMSYVSANQVVYFTEGASGELQVTKSAPNSVTSAFQVKPYCVK